MKVMQNIKRIAIGIMLLSFALAWPTVSVAAEAESIDIVDYGLYKTTFDQWKTAPKTARGEIELVDSKELVELTEDIPGSAGTEFGIRYVVNGRKEGKKVRLLVRVSHSDLNSSEEWVISRQVGTPAFDGWKFDTDSQIVPGNLTIELFHKGTKLAEQSFTIYEP
jgi:hypothetical protein